VSPSRGGPLNPGGVRPAQGLLDFVGRVELAAQPDEVTMRAGKPKGSRISQQQHCYGDFSQNENSLPPVAVLHLLEIRVAEITSRNEVRLGEVGAQGIVAVIRDNRGGQYQAPHDDSTSNGQEGMVWHAGRLGWAEQLWSCCLPP
jgi:hypothetical protein